MAVSSFVALLLTYELARAFFRKKRSSLPTIVALAAEGQTVAISKLLEQGISIEETGPNGETALMMAARNNRLETAIFLVSAGADVAKKSLRGNNAAEIAKRHGNHDLAAMLAR